MGAGDISLQQQEKKGHVMNINENLADLFYALAEIRRQTDNERIKVMADAMETTAMEIEALVPGEGRTPMPDLSF